MGIEIRPTGEATAITGAGRVIGQAQAREKSREEAQRVQELAFKQQAQATADQWELQKMILNSQLDFQHEQRMVQLDYEKFERAKAWDVEKMEIASRMDFQREEQKIQKQISSLDNESEAFEKYLKENPSDAKEPWAKAKREEFNNRRIEIQAGGTFNPPISQFQPKKEDALSALLKTMVSENPNVPGGVSIDPTKAKEVGMVELVAPDGTIGFVPPNEWEAEKDTTYKEYRLITPPKPRTTPFLQQKVGTISDLVNWLRRPVGK